MKQKQILSAKDINEKQRYLSELSDVLKGRQYVDKHLYAFHKLGVFVNICESLAQTSDADIAVNQLIANHKYCTNNLLSSGGLAPGTGSLYENMVFVPFMMGQGVPLQPSLSKPGISVDKSRSKPPTTAYRYHLAQALSASIKAR
ncbi:unnamed protein product [Medioppia subpectinata]|uniref:Uncharacterized protein n=1 Tax=Medioppia subpectinata TaxID=1979941 RepID=A0A7R9LJF4_9ACAR|nr:unnamed protein product [Medioppia subpectinata]CAG2119365.1 unnamed protein product [Medioppia subpectinata]